MIVLGVNAFHGDASAAILVNGRLVAAVEEERFTRVKHDAGLPINAVRYCLAAAGARLSDVDHIAIPRDPRAHLLRKTWHALRMPRFTAGRLLVHARTAGIVQALARELGEDSTPLRAREHRVEHHRAHIASAFFASPFDRAAVLSLDGLGDFSSARWGAGEGSRLHLRGGVAFPHSIGLCYTAFTQLLGFPHYGDEYKVMGLASYGAPTQLETMRHILRTGPAPGYALDLSCFTHHRTGPAMSWDGGTPVLGQLFSDNLERRVGPRREPAAALEAHHHEVAASLQARLDEVVAEHWTHVARGAASGNLAYAGGVALNCVANGRALAHGETQRLFIPPPAGDGGLSLGAALQVWHEVLGQPRDFVLEHAAWGPEYDEATITRALDDAGLTRRRADDAAVLARNVADSLVQGRVVGWFQGRSEFGPRALGQRSILADPRRADMQGLLNARIKRRESFRPFAPSVMAEHTAEWFDGPLLSPFMLLAVPVRQHKRALVPAVTHVDGTSRPQAVNRAALPLYWSLISEFHDRTGVPMVLNTSFNDNEPMVQTPADAVRSFTRGDLDVLAIGPFLVTRDPA